MVRDKIAAERQWSIDQGLLDPVTGMPTDAGLRYAARNIAMGASDTGLPSGMMGAIKAYHGSPHSFDRFDMSRIGTGEGAQAYGHGLYFAGNEGVARGYRDRLTPQSLPDYTVGSEPVQTVLSRDWGKTPPGASYVLERLNRGDPPVLIENFLKRNAPYDRTYRAALDWLDANKSRIGEVPAPTGHMYEVSLNVEPRQLLDWDKPLAAQAVPVREGVRQAVTPVNFRELDTGTARNWNMGEGYQFVGGRMNPTATATRFREAGIPGIQYLDAGSRAAGEGSRNYVMFDDALINIMRKYALPGMIMGSAAAVNPLVDFR